MLFEHFLKKLDISLFKVILVFFMFLVFIPNLILFALSLSREYRQSNQEQLADLNSRLSIINQNIDTKLDQIEMLSKIIVNNENIVDFLARDYMGRVPDFDRYYYQAAKTINSIYYHDLKNDYKIRIFFANSSIPEGFGVFYNANRILDQNWYRNFADEPFIEEKFFIYEITRSSSFFRQAFGVPIRDENVVVYVQNIYTSQGEYLGLMSIESKLDHILSVKIESDIDYYLSTKDHLIYSPDFIDDKAEFFSYLSDNSSEHTPMWKEHSVISHYNQRLELYHGLMLQHTPLVLTYAGYWQIYLITNFLILALILFFAVLLHRLYINMYKNIYLLEDAVQGYEKVKIKPSRIREINIFTQNINYLIERIDVLVNERIERETAQKNAQIRDIYSRISPHLFYNTLDLISSAMIIEGKIEIAEKISSFGKVLRYSFKKDLYSSLDEEINYLKVYCDLYQLKYNNMVRLHVNIPDQLKSFRIIRFVLQPIVENSIKYGYKSNGSILIISIMVETAGDSLRIIVEDNGLGISPEKLSELRRLFNDPFVEEASDAKHGIGLLNVNQRLVLFYGDNNKLEIDSVENEFTRVILTVKQL